MIKKLNVERWVEDCEFTNIISGELAFIDKNHKFEEWSFEDENGNYYHTDSDGCGLWVNGRQIIGTCDFYLRGMSFSGARKKIKRELHNIQENERWVSFLGKRWILMRAFAIGIVVKKLSRW